MSTDKKSRKQVATSKAKYSAPVVVDLGELARGYGGCNNGSAPTGSCSTGVGLATPVGCQNGNRDATGCAGGSRFGA